MTLSEFISSERERFAIDDNNKFAICFSQISRYRLFLTLILRRYEEVNRRFVENSKASQALMAQGAHAMTDEQMVLYNEGVELMPKVQLEIETNYVFAKICLDKVAHALEFYFGPARKRPLDSHDDLVKNFLAYAEAKGLTLPDGFMAAARALKRDISDYRDYEIAHEKSPRRMSGVSYDEQGRLRMMAIQFMPTERDQQVDSKFPHDLMSDLDLYLAQVIDLVKSNENKTRLSLK